MAVLKKPSVESGHWYHPDGRPCHSIEMANGQGWRNTTLKDARRLLLMPSVSGILSVMAKPGLDRWKLVQVAEAAHAFPLNKGRESIDYWTKRVINQAFQQVKDAAHLGNRVHKALESGDWTEDLLPYVEPVVQWITTNEVMILDQEITLVNAKQGFGGTCDVTATGRNQSRLIIDFKTRKTTPGKKVTAFDGQAMQIAAYGETYWGDLQNVWGANLIISTTEPGRLEIIPYSPEELMEAYGAFLHCAALWRHLNQYDPRLS